MQRVLGFSLVELLTVVAIVGILGAVGYPSYQNYTREARRSDGHAALLAMAIEQERFYLSNNSYSATTSDLWTANSGGKFISNEGFYVLAAASGNASTFTVRATATGIQADDTDCTTIELDNTGLKAARTSGGADNAAACW